MGAFQGVTSSTIAPATTDRGTKIVKPGNDMDKNAFLRILTAELSNQDPENAKDSTAYVAQMAQFAGLEQMTNLNTTMMLSAANGTMGQKVMINGRDSNGDQYTGVVREVARKGSNIKVNVELTNSAGKTQMKEFDYSDVLSVIETKANPIDTLNGNMGFLLATSLMGKKVEITNPSEDNKKYNGIVKGVNKDGSGINVEVELNDAGEPKPIKNFSYDTITKVDTP